MQLHFEKWQACQNDFAVFWLSDLDGEAVLDSLKRQARALCDRRAGVGADGLLALRTKKPGELMPYALTIINSDGSLAANCGNGLRCAALSVLKAHRERGGGGAPPELVQLNVQGATLASRFLGAAAASPLVTVAMGVPTLAGNVSWRDAARREVATLAAALDVPELARAVDVCEIGNPHVVITSDLASRALLMQLGPALQSCPAWDGMNVHLVRARPLTEQDQLRAGAELGHPVAARFEAFVWERGAGETMACGSGACAIAALAIASGLVGRDAHVAVDMPGGRLYVGHPAAEAPVLLTGPGTFVYAGKVSI